MFFNKSFVLQAMKIHISDGARECMLDYPQYSFEQRGTVEVKVLHLRSFNRLIRWPLFVFLPIQKEANVLVCIAHT